MIMNDYSEYILIADVTTFSVYIVIFTLVFMVGYIKRATAVYNTALKHKGSQYADLAWYPFCGVIAMANLTKSKYGVAVTSSILFFIAFACMLVVMLINKAVTGWLLGLCAVLYILYGIAHFKILKKYMNCYYPDISDGYIVFSCIMPFFKYLIHIDF